jgi:hypothetical protein
MNGASRWSRVLVIAGLAAMLIGAVDPLEGSLLILPGSGLVALGALLGKSRHRRFLLWSFILVAVGVGAGVGFSTIGGFGSPPGHSYWWALVLLPYPVGWIMGLVGAIRVLGEAGNMARSQGKLWIGLAIALSVIVVAAGYPAFQRKFGFPASLIWTAAVVAGVWLIYLIRSWALSSKRDDPKGDE